MNETMDLSIMQLFRRTFPFVMTRILTYVVFALVAFLFLGIMIGVGFLLIKMFGENSFFFIIVMIISFGAVYGGLKFLERYFLYMVKTGHIAVIVELMQNGKIPEGKGMIAYGKDKVTENFGASNVAFAVDKLVYASVKQIQRWIFRIGNVFSFIPGSKNIIGIINAIMSVSLNYIDEAIMSYIFLQKGKENKQSVWKSASDGVVLYAQSWKGILKTGAGAVLFIYAFNIGVFLLLVFPLMFVGKLIAGDTQGLGTFTGFLAVVGAYVITTVIKRALIDPLVTIAMIRQYQISIRSLEPAIDLQDKLLGVSSRFRQLHNKSKSHAATETKEPPQGVLHN